MKKRLAIQPDYKKIQSDEIDNVISTLKKGGTLRYVKGVPFFNKRYIKEVHFLPKWFTKG